jgi:hypothetical protein
MKKGSKIKLAILLVICAMCIYMSVCISVVAYKSADIMVSCQESGGAYAYNGERKVKVVGTFIKISDVKIKCVSKKDIKNLKEYKPEEAHEK